MSEDWIDEATRRRVQSASVSSTPRRGNVAPYEDVVLLDTISERSGRDARASTVSATTQFGAQQSAAASAAAAAASVAACHGATAHAPPSAPSSSVAAGDADSTAAAGPSLARDTAPGADSARPHSFAGVSNLPSPVKGAAPAVAPLSVWQPRALATLPWYHGKLSRHVAETLLMGNAAEGSYLLRESESAPSACSLSLSVRCANSVKHYAIERRGDSYIFGHRSFETPAELSKHLGNFPALSGESGVMTVLRYPYPRKVDELERFDQVEFHAESSTSSSKRQPVLSIASREGFLIKQGKNRKNWKKRWFVLERQALSYYAKRGDPSPIRVIDLQDCVSVSQNLDMGKAHCFELQCAKRTFFLVASSDKEREEWMEILAWKIRSGR